MATGSKRRGVRQLAPDDWIHAAMEGLLKQGPRGVRITRLARELGVTPGSFYWHFRDRDEFRDRIIEYWMSQMIARAASVAVGAGTGVLQLRALPDLLVERKLPDYDAAMRTWALTEPVVAEGVARADALRIRRVASMFEEAGFSKEVAAVRAQTVYWIFLGSVGSDPKLRFHAFKELIEVFLANK